MPPRPVPTTDGEHGGWWPGEWWALEVGGQGRVYGALGKGQAGQGDVVLAVGGGSVRGSQTPRDCM